MIEFKNVSKIYPNGKTALKNINLSFDKGNFIVFIGTSGSGKTTCMRMINGMIKPSKGEVLIDGLNVSKTDLVKLRRGIGYVIQRIGLMPHMTIYDNIVTVPKLLKWDKAKMEKTAKELLKKVSLPENLLERYPSELSGGQQQRIGVIRALAADQEIILMDEPFGALDPITRNALQISVKHLQQNLGKTFILVTHDMDEALTLADKVAILDKGELIQFDTPDNILKNPANEFVKSLLGEERLAYAQSHLKTVKEIMISDPIKVRKGTSIFNAVKLMKDKRVDNLFVVDEDNVIEGFVNVFSIEKLGKKTGNIDSLIRDAFFINQDTLIRDAIYYIFEQDLKNIPVVDNDNKLVGLITRASIVDILYENLNNSTDISENLESELYSTKDF